MERVQYSRSLAVHPRTQGWWALAAFVVATQLAGLVGSFVSPGVSESATLWDAALRKPAWAPPNAVFGPTWTVLYTLIAIAAWRVHQRPISPLRSAALTAFWIQLVLNALWTPIFYGMRSIGLAFAEILLLLLAIAWTLRLFLRADRMAGLLLLPYLAWVIFATALNFEILRLNA